MNKNSKLRLKVALKNYNKGQKETVFTIPMTVPGGKQLGERKQTISIGNIKRISTKPKVAANQFGSTNQE